MHNPLDEEALAAALLAETLDTDPFVCALRCAWNPQDLSASAHLHLVTQVVELGPLTEEELEAARETRSAIEHKRDEFLQQWAEPRRPQTNVLAFWPTRKRPFLAASAGISLVAVAAAFLLWVRTESAAPQAGASFRVDSPTEALFQTPFEVGARSARADRISQARSNDYRENQFLAWGAP
jgi:hypothetical protein